MKSFFQSPRACLPCDFTSMQVAQLLNNSLSSQLTMMGVRERARWCVSLGRVCVCFVCWQWENNSSWVHKTEEGFSSAVLRPLSQSGLVATSAVNLPLLCCRERDTHTHHRSKVHRFEETFELIKRQEAGKVWSKAASYVKSYWTITKLPVLTDKGLSLPMRRADSRLKSRILRVF